MKMIIVAGGTGGHIYPGLAIAEEIKLRDPEGEILFIGSEEGLEKDLISRDGHKLVFIRARALLRKLSYKALSAPFVSTIGFFQALGILKRFAPKAIIATGGYVSMPVVLAGRLLGIPIYLHEQNVLPGAVNRLCKHFAKNIFLSFPESLPYIKGEVVGNPVRSNIREAQKSSSLQSLNLPRDKKIILIMGGSQGSKKINETVISKVDAIPSSCFILHIIGNRDYNWISRYLNGKKIENYRALPYLHDMAQALAASDLVISRAGATAIAEFLVCGLPMVLIPFPYAAEDHQRLNARVIEEKGAATVIEDEAFTPDKFIEILSSASLDYAKMKAACLSLARPEAARKIVEIIYA